MVIKKKHLRALSKAISLIADGMFIDNIGNIGDISVPEDIGDSGSLGDISVPDNTDGSTGEGEFDLGKNGVIFIAMLILKKSQDYVPVDTGNLRDSVYLEELGEDKWRILYDTPYAAVQHEDIDFQHMEPGRAKYLEDAAFEILNLIQDNGDPPLFTFQITFPGNGTVALEINTINKIEFMMKRNIREKLLHMTVNELWGGLDG